MLVFSVSLYGCGGSSDGSATTPTITTAPTISGTAATGIPIAGIVYVTDSTGTTINAPIDPTGNYTADITDMSPPYIISAVPNDTGLQTQYSYASGSGTTNITPLTTLTFFNAAGIDATQQDLGALASSWASLHNTISSQALAEAQAVVNANFASLFSDQGLNGNTFNIFTDSFGANGTGFDALLDQLNFIFDFVNVIFSVTVTGDPFFTFNENINISSINIPGVITGSGFGVITFSGPGASVLPSTTFNSVSFTESPFTESNGSLLVWTSNDNMIVSVAIVGNVVMQIQVGSLVNTWIIDSSFAKINGIYDGTAVTFVSETLIEGDGGAGDLVMNGSLSKSTPPKVIVDPPVIVEPPVIVDPPVSSLSCEEIKSSSTAFSVDCNSNTATGYYWSIGERQETYGFWGLTNSGVEPTCNADTLGSTAQTAAWSATTSIAGFWTVYTDWCKVAADGPGEVLNPGCSYEGGPDWGGCGDHCGIYKATCTRTN